MEVLYDNVIYVLTTSVQHLLIITYIAEANVLASMEIAYHVTEFLTEAKASNAVPMMNAVFLAAANKLRFVYDDKIFKKTHF